nr:MAG TPA: hypothetical protein [Caudoviricetes sp.]
MGVTLTVPVGAGRSFLFWFHNYFLCQQNDQVVCLLD